jgi:hypothetical protein
MHTDRSPSLDIDSTPRRRLIAEAATWTVNHIEAADPQPLGRTHEAGRLCPVPLRRSVLRRHARQLRNGRTAR